MFAKFPIRRSAILAHNSCRSFRLTDAILNSETIEYRNGDLMIFKDGESNVVNPYLTDILVRTMGDYIDNKQNFAYRPPTNVLFSPDGNHWYSHTHLGWGEILWRPTIVEDDVISAKVEMKETVESRTNIVDLIDFPCFER